MIELDIKSLLQEALSNAPAAETAEEIMGRADAIEVDIESRDRRRRPTPALIAISVAAAVAVGLIAMTVSRDHEVVPGKQPPSTDQPISITDPLSIDLDALVQATSAAETGAAPTRTYLLPDLGSLPSGWSIISRSGGNSPRPNVTGDIPAFQWIVTLRSPAGARFRVFVQNILSIGPLPGDQTVKLPDGTPARLGEMGLVWNLGSGAQISIQRGDANRDDDQLIELARQLHYIEVDHLPLDPPATVDGSPGTSLATFAGRIGGAPWQVRIPASDLRSAFVYLAGQSVYGFGNERVSQPNVSPAWYALLVGVGTPGAVVVGFTPPTVTTVSLELRTGETVTLPVDQRANETWFAAPIPAGLGPAAFIFRDALGNTIRLASMPTIPRDPWGSTDLFPVA